MQKIINIPVEYKRLFDKDWREAAVYGGRYSLKSHTVARVLLIRARESKIRIACLREYQNSITDSSYQLLVDLINQYGLTDFKITDKSIINTINGSDFLFKGLHLNEQNIKSTEGIDIAWVEEAQTVSSSSIDILTPTIRKPGSQIIYTYNRLLEEDAVHTRLVLEGRPNTLIINTNYDIAEKYGWMPDVIKNEIESDKLYRPGLYKHKWLGEPINQETRIYRDWTEMETIPASANLIIRGLDFGFSNDPTAIVDIYEFNHAFIFDEILYRKGLSNRAIADFLLSQPIQVDVMADSAEPKSIDEIHNYGVDIHAAQKGQGSVNQGIQFIQDQVIFYTARSINLRKESRNYLWLTDKAGKHINIPQDFDNHCFAPSTLIYTTKGKRTIKSLVGKYGYLYSRDGSIQRFNNVRPTRTNTKTIKLTFDDGQMLEVTPDHLLLQPNGHWIEASLLRPLDMIQSGTYEIPRADIQWQNISSIFGREIFQSWHKTFTSGSLGILQRFYTKWLSYSSHGQEYSQQLNRQPRTQNQTFTFKRSHDSRETRMGKKTRRNYKTPYQEVACIKRGSRVASVTWKESNDEPKTYYQKLCSLPQRIQDYRQKSKYKILPSELQNESPTKKVTGISRGFQTVTYNLEVKNTHCLIANGVIAHNCLDAIRYGLESYIYLSKQNSGVVRQRPPEEQRLSPHYGNTDGSTSSVGIDLEKVLKSKKFNDSWRNR